MGMINKIIDFYYPYRMRYDVKDKTLLIYTPMYVSDYVNLKRLLKIYKCDVKDIRILGKEKKR